MHATSDTAATHPTAIVSSRTRRLAALRPEETNEPDLGRIARRIAMDLTTGDPSSCDAVYAVAIARPATGGLEVSSYSATGQSLDDRQGRLKVAPDGGTMLYVSSNRGGSWTLVGAFAEGGTAAAVADLWCSGILEIPNTSQTA